jgi:hypothetical protein
LNFFVQLLEDLARDLVAQDDHEHAALRIPGLSCGLSAFWIIRSPSH